MFIKFYKQTKMFIPPEYFTQERIELDLGILRMYYDLCMQLNVNEDIDIEKTFLRLSQLVGKPSFLKESTLLAQFIKEKLAQEDEMFTTKDDLSNYNKIC